MGGKPQTALSTEHFFSFLGYFYEKLHVWVFSQRSIFPSGNIINAGSTIQTLHSVSGLQKRILHLVHTVHIFSSEDCVVLTPWLFFKNECLLNFHCCKAPNLTEVSLQAGTWPPLELETLKMVWLTCIHSFAPAVMDMHTRRHLVQEKLKEWGKKLPRGRRVVSTRCAGERITYPL